MPEPQRRERRRTHLDASVVPVERALLARAADAEKFAGQLFERAKAPDLASDEPAAEFAVRRAETLDAVAAEFRALAEELHYW